MVTMDTYKDVCGDGTVVVSIRKEHIDKVFEAIGDQLPDKMAEIPSGGFILLWEGIEFGYGLSSWYTYLVDLLESIEEEFDDSHFSIETAVWNARGGFDVEFNYHGDFGGFEPDITYKLWGTVVNPEQFTKKKK